MKLKEDVEVYEDFNESEELEREEEMAFVQIKECHEKLSLLKFGYEKRLEGIQKRRKSLGQNVMASGTLFFVICMIDAFFSFIFASPGGRFIAMAIETWIAVGALFIFFFKTLFKLIKDILIYLIHTEKKIFYHYIQHNQIVTICEEERVYKKFLVVVLEDIRELERLQKKEKQGEERLTSEEKAYVQNVQTEYPDIQANFDVIFIMPFKMSKKTIYMVMFVVALIFAVFVMIISNKW